MEELRCSSCNSVSFTEDLHFYICEYCGGKIKKDRVEVKASFTVSSSAASLLERADLYWDLGNRDKARRLYQQVLDQDATIERARERAR